MVLFGFALGISVPGTDAQDSPCVDIVLRSAPISPVIPVDQIGACFLFEFVLCHQKV